MAGRVWLLRHGYSLWQERYDIAQVDPGGMTDAGLHDRGWRQARAAAVEVARLRQDLAVTSPYTRAIQTALALFERTPTPIHVEPLAGERVGDSCDIGRAPSELARDFPTLDFGRLTERWWYDGPVDARGIPVEPRWLLAARAQAFAEWVRTREEESIVVVSHSGFLRRRIGRHVENCELVEWGGEVSLFPEDAK